MFFLRSLTDQAKRDLIQQVAFSPELREFFTPENKRSALCGLMSTSSKQIAVIEATSAKPVSSNPRRAISESDQTFMPIHDFRLAELLSNWQAIGGPISEVAVSYRELYTLGKWFLASFDKFPADSANALRIFTDFQLIFPSPDPIDESLFLWLPMNNPEFQEKCMGIIHSFLRFVDAPVIPSGSAFSVVQPVPFPAADLFSFTFDVFSHSFARQLSLIEQIESDFGIAKFLGCSRESFRSLICVLHSLHISGGFESWEFCVDRFQFVASLIKQIPRSHKLKPAPMCSILLYQLSLFAHRLTSTGVASEEIITRFFLENGNGCSAITPFFIAVSMAGTFSMQSVDTLMTAFREFEARDAFEALFAKDFLFQLGVLAQYSYIVRDEETARRWCDLRLEDRIEGALEIRNIEMDFELRSLIMPAFGELAKKGIRMDSIRKRMTATLTAISGISF
jgi:hypothetical protein